MPSQDAKQVIVFSVLPGEVTIAVACKAQAAP